MNKPTFNAELTTEELEALRDLSKRLGFFLTTGPRAGDGSPRQLLIALATAAQQDSQRTAAMLKEVLSLQA